jgi:hypothetical protein
MSLRSEQVGSSLELPGSHPCEPHFADLATQRWAPVCFRLLEFLV